MSIAFVCFLILPIKITHSETYTDHPLDQITKVYHEKDTAFNAFPSLHVAFTMYAWLILLTERRRIALWTAPIAGGIIASVLLIKTHLIIDAIGGIILAGGVFFWWVSTVKGTQQLQKRSSRRA
jgi:membrane-associated phospholipid phosphatase